MEKLIMIALALCAWGSVMWVALSDSGNRYAAAQRLNIGNCWPSCEPLKVGQVVSYTIITPATGKKE